MRACREHPWFGSIDFAKLDKMELEPPFKPKVKSAEDVGNFDTYFTSEKARLSPNGTTPISAEEQQAFSDFDTVKKL